jgi:putative copper export protein
MKKVKRRPPQLILHRRRKVVARASLLGAVPVLLACCMPVMAQSANDAWRQDYGAIPLWFKLLVFVPLAGIALIVLRRMFQSKNGGYGAGGDWRDSDDCGGGDGGGD